jgi:hypothetical protein
MSSWDATSNQGRLKGARRKWEKQKSRRLGRWGGFRSLPAKFSRALPLAALWFVLWWCPSAAIPRMGANLSAHFGVAVKKPSAVCLYIRDSKLAPGSPLTLVLPSPPQSTLKAEVVRAAAANDCPSIGDSGEAGLTSYEIKLLGEGSPPVAPAIAVYGYSGRFRTQGRYVVADVGRNGEHNFFRSCTSSEGVHLTVWSREPLRGTRIWHQYYYLGYDVEANCTPAESHDPTN